METTLIVLTVFVGITAVAFVVQAIAMMGLLSTAQKLKEKVDVFIPKAEDFIESSQHKVGETTKQVAEITERVAEITLRVSSILELAQKQMVRVDEVMSDASSRAKVQLEHAEDVLNNTLSHVNNTVNAVHGTILRPVREINGVTAGVKAAVSHFLKGGAPANVAQVTTDEEMFI